MKSGKEKILNGSLIVVSVVFFILIPIGFAILKLHQTIQESFISSAAQALLFLGLPALYLIIRRFGKFVRPAKLIICLTASFYYIAVYFLIGYKIYTGNRLDLFFLLDSYEEILETGFNIFGSYLSVLILFFWLLWFFYFFLFLKLLNFLAKKIKTRSIFPLLACLIVFPSAFIVFPLSDSYIFHQYKAVFKTIKTRTVTTVKFLDTSIFENPPPETNNESVFILQLESLNSLALLGNMSQNGKRYEEIYIPNLYNISKKGVFFPFFWSNSIQTNRAQANIFCGINNNLGKAYSFNPELIKVKCLPQLLKERGYKTIFFRSDDLWFTNLGNFAEAIGFEEVHQKDIMLEGDKEYRWGYDDCVFYKRAFEYLKEKYPKGEKLFVYFEVSSRHIPFPPDEEYSFVHKFSPSSSHLENYLNSMLEEDYCAQKFYEEFQEYNNGNTHLFILSDQSYPLGIHTSSNENGAFNENFLVPLIYIPPETKKDEFKIGIQIKNFFPSLTDIMPTIFGLLDNKDYLNSFAFALKKNGLKTNYEDCHVLVQPYSNGGEIAVVRGFDKYIYSLAKEKMVHYDLKADLLEQHPVAILTNLSYEEFKEKYYCERYKTIKQEISIFEGQIHIGDNEIEKDWPAYWHEFTEKNPVGEIFTLNFELSVPVKISHLRIKGADIQRHHPIYINGKEVGATCATGYNQSVCTIELNPPIMLKAKNNITIFNKGMSAENLDDYAIYQIALITD